MLFKDTRDMIFVKVRFSVDDFLLDGVGEGVCIQVV